MTNQDIQNKIELMKKIVRDLEREKSIKNEWIEIEKKEKKREYQDAEMVGIWEDRIKEIELEIEVLENTIKSLEMELTAEA